VSGAFRINGEPDLVVKFLDVTKNNGTRKPDWYNGSMTKQPRKCGSENVEDKEQAASSRRVCSTIRIIAFNAVRCKDKVRPHPQKIGWPAASFVSQGQSRPSYLRQDPMICWLQQDVLRYSVLVNLPLSIMSISVHRTGRPQTHFKLKPPPDPFLIRIEE
jgi:hypothetical protein